MKNLQVLKTHSHSEDQRLALLRIIIENKLNIKLRDLINYSISLLEQQGVEIKNDHAEKKFLILSKRE